MFFAVFFIVAPFIFALYLSYNSFVNDGDNKSPKLIHKRNNLLFLAKSPVILLLQPKIHLFLNTKFTYYQKLNLEQKRKFALRVGGFMMSAEFSGKEGFKVTEEVKIYVSACAVQLTFGLEGYLLENIDYIQIFPKKYYSRLSQAYHLGEYRRDGILRLSWVDFEKGFNEGESGVNLGLHEMAHALEVGMLNDNSTDEFFENYYIRWKAVMQETFEQMSFRGEKTILRAYAGANEHEFFAVCVEHFFERPSEFKHNLPHVYETLAILLNQDPTNSQSSPRIDEIPALEDVVFPENNEIFKTEFSVSRFIRLIVRLELTLPVIFVLYQLYQSVSPIYFVFWVWTALILLSAKRFRNSAIVHVYEEGLTFSNPFSLRKKHVFSFDNIVYATVNISLSGKKSLKIFYTNKGEFATKSFDLPSTYENIKMVIAQLKQKKIHIYDVGTK
jgi:Mlc titration factor MtfA (ptsG expression regulator)